MLRASVTAEKAGVRTVSLVGKGFAGQARLIGEALGIRNLAIAEYPGVIMNDDDETFREKVAGSLVDQIVAGIATQAELADRSTPDPAPRDIVCAGTLDDIQEHFYERGWTDGLPINPPTIAAVERFLQFTPRKPDEVIGALLPERRQATVWSVAVNGVMAGCRPEYMPLLVAAVEAIADPEFKLEDAGSTPGWEPLVTVSGPLVRLLKFNCGQGVLRVGRRANTSIGRFLRLYMRNVAGLRIPGEGSTTGTDKGCIAAGFNVALAENDEAIAELGWQPYRAEKGFATEDTTVTVRSTGSVSLPIYVGGSHAMDVARRVADIWGNGDCARRSYGGMEFGRYHPLLVMSPALAKLLAQDGWTKDDLRRYLRENVTIPAGRAQRDAWNSGVTELNVYQRAREGILPPEYGESEDPDRLVPVFPRAEWIDIVIAGDADRNQARGYVNNHRQGVPVSRRAEPVQGWEALATNGRP